MKRLLASLAIATIVLSPLAFTRGHAAAAPQPQFRDVCAIPERTAAERSTMRCFAIQHLVAQLPTSSPSFPGGYHPADLQAAYNLVAAAKSGGKGMTVAVVDVFDDPNAEADLAAYRKQFGLPPCTTANGCFSKINDLGQSSPLPKADPTGGWQVEASLDVDMVSAICPNCHIMLVEAFNPQKSPDDTYPLAYGVNWAAYLGANAISNSYGTSNGEIPVQLKLDKYYAHPGVTASSGDSGYRAAYPAGSSVLTAVGGTSLVKGGGGARGWTETAWVGAGSYCSPVEPKPTWQKDTGCKMRTYADVSAVADPSTGVAFYDTFNGGGGWGVVGGTSVASPIIASVYALAGNSSKTVAGSYPYSHHSASQINDITSGSNGSCGTYICNAGKGYDGPTGWGTPNGTGGF